MRQNKKVIYKGKNLLVLRDGTMAQFIILQVFGAPGVFKFSEKDYYFEQEFYCGTILCCQKS